MRKSEIEVQVTLEPGHYWLSDPCYTIKDEDWLPWLEACNYREEDNLVGNIPGTNLSAVGFRTAWGDGVYPYQQMNGWRGEWRDKAELGVDAGLIGFVPKEYGGEASLYVTGVHFEHPTTITWREGNLSWITSNGESFRVVTDGSDEDDF